MPKLTRSPLVKSVVKSSSRSLTGADPAGASRRFAAVSPTFGRLFEGTDVDTPGQTTMSRMREEPTPPMSRLREEPTPPMSRLREEQTTQQQQHVSFTTVTAVGDEPLARRAESTDFARRAEFVRAMFPNGWPRPRKPVSFCQCRFRPKRPQRSPAKPSRTHTQVRLPGRTTDVRLTTHPERQRNESLSCPHLWITMWTVGHRSARRPPTPQKGLFVVER